MRLDPPIPANTYHDGFGNFCHVIRAPAGRLPVSADFLVQDSGGIRGERSGEGSGHTYDWEPADTYAKACEIVADLKQRKPALQMSPQVDCRLCHPDRHN